jgi:IS5 family transposase
MLATINAKLIERGLLLKAGTDLIAAPNSTKNNSGECEPEMHQTKKCNQSHFGMKAHIGANAESDLVHTVTGTSFCVSCPFPLDGLQEDDNDRCFINRGFVETRQHKYRQIFALVNVNFPDLLIVDPMPVF